jgi:hypothetical protein
MTQDTAVKRHPGQDTLDRLNANTTYPVVGSNAPPVEIVDREYYEGTIKELRAENEKLRSILSALGQVVDAALR